MTRQSRPGLALAAFGAIVVITAAWWALALWPVEATAPAWVLRTRAVCFGASPNGLPDAGGWVLLVGQPIGMVGLLVAIWGADLRAGLARVTATVPGQLAAGLVLAAGVAALAGVAVRVQDAGVEAFSTGAGRELAAALTRIDDEAPALNLVDQHGRRLSLDAFRGRPVLVTFAFAHCGTICPMVVADALAAQRQLTGERPALLVVTLDPWRDTPARLPAIADQWKLGPDAHVVSGELMEVERTLNAWRIPRVRNEQTGDISHPALVYVVGPNGRITYALEGHPDAIVAAVRSG